MRGLGYAPHENRAGLSFVRRLGRNEYPKFHVYINEEGAEEIILNLHLDQKAPSYAGSSAHSGEYEGEVVEKEIERIKDLLKI